METGKLTGETHYACREIVAERDRLRAELGDYRSAVKGFCERLDWAADTYKQQPHIAALFALAARKGEGENDATT